MGIYLKSVLAGVAAAVLACVLCFGLTAAVMVIRLQVDLASTGSGGLGAVSSGFSEACLVLALPGGFAIGFFCMFRRLRKRLATTVRS